jgi:hypothetical protein
VWLLARVDPSCAASFGEARPVVAWPLAPSNHATRDHRQNHPTKIDTRRVVHSTIGCPQATPGAAGSVGVAP